MLEVTRLVKRFGTLSAVDGVSFSVAGGEIVGLLGPNGAGKTTTLSIVSGLLRPDAGEVRIDGRILNGDADPLKRAIGVVPQELALYDELSSLDNLHFFGGLYGLSRTVLDDSIDRVLNLVGLTGRASERVKGYSGGMKRRLNLAASLLHDPAILLLDEPTVGIDPQSRNAIFENLLALKSEGKALVYSTHYMEEAERLCDRVVILDHGRVVAQDTVRDLYRRVASTNRIAIEVDDPTDGPWRSLLKELPGVIDATLDRAILTVEVVDLAVAPSVLSRVAESGRRVVHFTSLRPNLEAVFFALTGSKESNA
jgi:ABC-2 type transport system ATP-binding protein